MIRGGLLGWIRGLDQGGGRLLSICSSQLATPFNSQHPAIIGFPCPAHRGLIGLLRQHRRFADHRHLMLLWAYGQGFCCQQLFCDQKSVIFQLESSGLRDSARIVRPLLVVAIAVLASSL